jgi:predicted small metal-binding protein
MRAVEFPCGEHLEANNDEELLKEARKHADEDHANEYEDWQLRQMITTGAYDTGG